MSNIFNNYFEKLEAVYQDIFETKPTICYTENMNKALILGEADLYQEVEWRAVLQNEKIDWEKLETIFKFEINSESTFYI